MERLSAVTRPTSRSRSNRTASDAQPLPRKTVQAEHKDQRAKETRLLTLSDADGAVQWLNASKGTCSHDRVVFIRKELEALRSEWAAHSLGPPPWVNANFHQEQRQLEKRHRALNELLSEYTFRPRVTHLEPSTVWRFGMVPDDKKECFTMPVAGRTISEPDAVMALMRLADIGDLRKVRLCETCKERWRVAAKRNYRFCSAQCREAFYAKAPDYHERKAANQRKYRQQLKQNEAAQDSFWKGR